MSFGVNVCRGGQKWWLFSGRNNRNYKLKWIWLKTKCKNKSVLTFWPLHMFKAVKILKLNNTQTRIVTSTHPGTFTMHCYSQWPIDQKPKYQCHGSCDSQQYVRYHSLLGGDGAIRLLCAFVGEMVPYGCYVFVSITGFRIRNIRVNSLSEYYNTLRTNMWLCLLLRINALIGRCNIGIFCPKTNLRKFHRNRCSRFWENNERLQHVYLLGWWNSCVWW